MPACPPLVLKHCDGELPCFHPQRTAAIGNAAVASVSALSLLRSFTSTRHLQVYLTGSVDDDEPDAHSRLVQSLDKSNTEIDQRDFPPLHFKVVSVDHPYVARKSAKEFQSVDGILKYTSLQKHYEHLPSVVVFLTSFSADWQQGDWAQVRCWPARTRSTV